MTLCRTITFLMYLFCRVFYLLCLFVCLFFLVEVSRLQQGELDKTESNSSCGKCLGDYFSGRYAVP